MTEHDDNDASIDAALRRHLHGDAEPGDDGFSLRVMAALPAQVLPQRRRWARWIRHAQWVAISLAAFGVAALLSGGTVDTPHVLAAGALMGLLVFWSIPSRWSRG